MISFKKLLPEQNNILKPRRVDGRKERAQQSALKPVLDYIKNGMEGDLDLEESILTKLPKELTHVRGDLIIDYSNITELPEGIQIEGELDAFDSQIIKLPNDIYVGRGINLENSRYISEIPKTLTYIRGDLNLAYSNISKLPDNLTVAGTLNLRDTLIEEIPKNLRATSLFLASTRYQLEIINKIRDTSFNVYNITKEVAKYIENDIKLKGGNVREVYM